jgi:general stress protein YciG
MSNKAKTTAVGKCRARTKAGRPCAAPAVRGGAYCAIHADPNRAAELGRKGGARNRKMYDVGTQEVSVPKSAADVRRVLAEVMAETRAGKMDPKLGSTLAYMATALLRAYEADPPTPANPPAMPNIYRALRFRAHSTGITETVQQKELQAPSTEARQALPAPTTEAVASQAKQEDEDVILDYQTGHPLTN